MPETPQSAQSPRVESPDSAPLHTEITQGAMILTLQRPERRNAVNQELADALDHAFAVAEVTPSIRVIVLTGADGYFSAGTDLSEGTSPKTEDGGSYGFVRRQRSVPVIAAVEGFALGGGFEMVLACDMVVAADDARFGLPEVKRGVVANCGAFFRTPSKLPPTLAAEMLLTGDPISAVRAQHMGLVNVVTEPGEALEAACDLAQRITANSPAAVAETTRALIEARELAEEELWPLTERASRVLWESEDRKEGIAAFFEKREPRWRTD
ncbi:crotonase/enoyl-CoA hydratase family protein [Brevibacterium daeguense]|uniref:Crotonase/enoyl-CoA hydratase family protein n=1 Tax=Brevibacterium daeguense TaxID=909936 RepID=A0ABP8EKD3_9MICO